MPEHTALDAPLRTDEFLEDAMHRWGNTVLRLALNQMGNVADAEDVFQDVFIRLLKDATPFTGDDHLKAWLLRVTVNRCHDMRKSGWKQRTAPLDEEGPTAADAAATAAEARNLLDSSVWEAVSELPPDLRAVVHLFYVEGYSTDEAARIVGCRPATARTRLFRAREALRNILEPPSPNPRKEADHDHRPVQRLRIEDAERASIQPPAR